MSRLTPKIIINIRKPKTFSFQQSNLLPPYAQLPENY